MEQTRRGMRERAGALTLCALLVFIGIFSVSRPAETPSGQLAARDGCSVRRGAPPLAGEASAFSREELLRGTLLPVSPKTPLPADFAEPSVRGVRSMVGSYLNAEEDAALTQEMIYALCVMQLEHPMERELRFTQGTVSAAQQESRRRDALARYMRVYPVAEAVQRTLEAVPGAQESEHRLGWAVDIELLGEKTLRGDDALLYTSCGTWLAENMWRYGFIRRYAPGDGADGHCEGIHLRYIGKPHAAAMHALGVGLEAYWELLRREGSLTVSFAAGDYAYIYCVPCDGGATFCLPPRAAYMVSGDGAGYAVLAVAVDGQF